MNLEEFTVNFMNLFGDHAYGLLRKMALKDNRRYLVGRSDLLRFSQGKLTRGLSGFDTVSVMREGYYEYEYFNICFFNNVLSHIIKSLATKKIPRIEIKNSAGDNIWEQFFLQPFPRIDTSRLKMETETDRELQAFPKFDDIFSERMVQRWGSAYRQFAVLNGPTAAYIQKETDSIFSGGKKILGVLLRGTDYTSLCPAGHPVQPPVGEVIEAAAQKMEEDRFDGIYLATEDGKIDRQFRERFADKLLVNQRLYYDGAFDKEGLSLIKDVHFDRENDDYFKGLEYLSSLIILSRCHSLIAGNCGGSQMAVYLNGGRYGYRHIYNLGLYS